jgi:hypothetical protein
MTRRPDVPAEIAIELLDAVVGGDWVVGAVNAAGPAIGAAYGENWKTAPCITRANLGAETAGFAAKVGTTVGGYFIGKKLGGSVNSSLLGTAGGLLGGDGIYSLVAERVRARYMRTCNVD